MEVWDLERAAEHLQVCSEIIGRLKLVPGGLEGVPTMSKQQRERILVKDDCDLFWLIRQLTDEQPPAEARDVECGTEPMIQIELSFYEAWKRGETVRQVDEADRCLKNDWRDG